MSKIFAIQILPIGISYTEDNFINVLIYLLCGGWVGNSVPGVHADAIGNVSLHFQIYNQYPLQLTDCPWEY
jgi:hypothetical protein